MTHLRGAFIQTEEETYPVARVCRALRVSSSGYYAWLTRKQVKRGRRKEVLIKKVRAAHEASRWTCGSPRVTA